MSSLYNSIVGACEAASITSIPQSVSASTKHNVPGWSEHVAPLKEKALFWNHILQDCGCPRTGHVADIHRLYRAKYHAAVKNIKQNESVVRSMKMAQSIVEGNNRDF